MKVLNSAHDFVRSASVHVTAIIRHALPVKNRQNTMVLVVYISDFILVILHTFSDMSGQMNISMLCLYKAMLACHLVNFVTFHRFFHNHILFSTQQS